MSPVRSVAVALTLAAVGVATGCATLSWYGDAAIGQMRILAARRDVADVLADPRTAPETAANLQRVADILSFAERYLRLETGQRYRTYVALERDTLAWNVFAAPEFSLDAHRWCYPIVGCAVYRGFFDPDKAQREAATLAARGFDVHVGRVAAYSTLGWFDDPLVSTFIDYSDERLAELLFHELAHGTLFVPGDSSFNEAFATFVGREGALEWLRAQGRDTAPYVASHRASARLAPLPRRLARTTAGAVCRAAGRGPAPPPEGSHDGGHARLLRGTPRVPRRPLRRLHVQALQQRPSRRLRGIRGSHPRLPHAVRPGGRELGGLSTG